MEDGPTTTPAPAGRGAAVRQEHVLDAAVSGEALETVFQPIVSLSDLRVVGFEALTRWPSLGHPSPEAVFARALATGRERELERTSIHAAIDAALRAGMPQGTAVFVNCEANTPYLGAASDDVVRRGAEGLQLIFELTERSLLTDPPALIRKVDALRADGFAVALDDVGAHVDSLALLDVLSPDVIKLDLALVQSQSRYQQARTWAAVLAHHERAGAIVLAEGIETGEHLARAHALGATLGQGFLFGRAGPLDAALTGGVVPPEIRRQRPRFDAGSPFDAVAAALPVRTERKSAVLALSRYLEAQATEATDPPMVLAATQRAEFFGGATSAIYQRMAASSPLVAVFGQGIPKDLGSGVRGIALADGDPLTTQWIVLTLGANVAAALLARERTDNDHRRDRDRLFDVAITNDRSLVTIAARHLLSRMP